MTAAVLLGVLIAMAPALSSAEDRISAMSQLLDMAGQKAGEGEILEVGSGKPVETGTDGETEEDDIDVPRGSPVTPLKICAQDDPDCTHVPGQAVGTVDLSAIEHASWRGGDRFASVPDYTYLSVHFDLEGNAYLSVLPPGWQSPLFYKFRKGMKGAWKFRNGHIYRVKLNVSIFRSRTSNYIEVRRDGVEDPVYKKRIREVLWLAHASGHPVIIGEREYRVYYSNAIAKVDGKEPARIVPDQHCVVLITNKGSKDDADFESYIIPRKDIESENVATYELLNKQKVGLRIPPDSQTLEFFAPQDKPDDAE